MWSATVANGFSLASGTELPAGNLAFPKGISTATEYPNFGLAPVPEPTTFGFLALTAFGFLARASLKITKTDS